MLLLLALLVLQALLALLALQALLTLASPSPHSRTDTCLGRCKLLNQKETSVPYVAVLAPAPAAGAEGVGRCCVSEYIMPYIRTATQATHALKESLYRH